MPKSAASEDYGQDGTGKGLRCWQLFTLDRVDHSDPARIDIETGADQVLEITSALRQMVHGRAQLDDHYRLH